VNKVLLFVTTLFPFTTIFAQEPLTPRPSPLEIVTTKYEDTYIKITYSRPAKNGRELFGDLVPFGEVWRTGANEATEITFTNPATIAGVPINAGTYSIYTIPEKDTWTIILNKDLGMWGAFSYNQDHDVLRVEANVDTMTTSYEPFTIEFDQKGLQETNLLFMWGKTRVVIPLKLE